MSTSTRTPLIQSLAARAFRAGAAAGILGGIPFGMMMAMMGMLPMIGMLVRVNTAFAGMLVHAAISAVTGAIYGLYAARLHQTWRSAALAGLAYGVIWWVLGALILMPALLGMFQNILVIGQMQWLSLMGHMVFGIVLSLSFLWLYHRAS
ncbi:MAG: hypothetical protein ACM3QS_18870 [Bacteroidota bacterium]